MHQSPIWTCISRRFPVGRALMKFLLYSPAHDGGHIKWPPVRAELAINFISARPTGNLPKRDRFILIGLSGKMLLRLSTDLKSDY